MSEVKATKLFVYLGRFLLVLASLALLGAWLTQSSGVTFLGFTQAHLYNDAIVLSLLGIGMFLDALWHSRSI